MCAAAAAYRTETGDVWRPRRSSHTSQTGYLTSAANASEFFLHRAPELASLTPAGNGLGHNQRGSVRIQTHAVGIKAPRYGAQQWRAFQRRALGRAT